MGKRPSLDPLPEHYRGRFTNVQAAIGLAGLKRLPEFIERTRRHARMLDDLLGDVPGITIPHIPPDRTHVYYQYCAYVPDSETVVKRCIRRGVDVAPMHVDVCTKMELFGWKGPAAPGAEHAATAVQVPVYDRSRTRKSNGSAARAASRSSVLRPTERHSRWFSEGRPRRRRSWK